MNCVQCGTEVNRYTNFCPNCNKVVEVVDQYLKPVNTGNSQFNTGNSQGCGIVILVLICVSVLISMCNSGDRERYKKNQEKVDRMAPSTQDFIWGQTHKNSDGTPQKWNK